ncbi:universal stress protein [Pontibacter sp. E15-1]|uniref:universal stress protein n=1 Tax=Pontibacter sp. E15-1 TaxID=2919918 RepID=UPI001F4F2893|nr:universal stress protein [Pontibacter sp. E15-1]MCJ8163317.1 universal stress protein [Pontibacter sp. E15-1]
METILVPTDFSEDARHALGYAIEMAQVTGSRIVLFHAFYQPLSFPSAADYAAVVRELERGKTLALEAYAQEAQLSLLQGSTLARKSAVSAYQGREVHPLANDGARHTETAGDAPTEMPAADLRCVCKFGFAFDEILKAVEAQRADLVVMGMRGGGALRRALLGRTTLSVMRGAHVPVLAIPLHARFEVFKSVVFAADLANLPARREVAMLGEFVRAFHARLQVLHLYKGEMGQQEEEQAAASLETLGECLPDIDYNVTFRQREDTADAIEQFMRQRHGDLLVLMPLRHTFLEMLLNKSLTQRMMARAFVPLLALPSGA